MLKGETVARTIPDSEYRREAQKREHSQKWGDATKSLELLRKAAYVDGNGFKNIDLAKVGQT